MPQAPRLAVAAGVNWLAFAATLAVAFFMAPYLLRALGDARYGVWCVAEAVLAYFTLFDLGIAACVVRYTARHHAAGETDALNRLASACVAVYAAAGAVALMLGAGVTTAVAPRLDDKLGTAGEVGPFLLLMLANLAVTLPLSVFPAVLDGLQRFAAKAVIRLVFLAVRVGGIFWVTETTPGLFPLAVVFTVTNLLEHAAFAALAWRHLPGLRLRVGLIDRDTLKRVRGYSVDAFLAMLAGRVTVQTGAVVVGGFLPVAAAAHYAVAARLVELAKNLLRSVTTTLTPAVSAREAADDLAGVRDVFVGGTRAVLYLVIPVHLGLLLFGRAFLECWLQGPQYADWCYPAMAVLTLTLTIGVAQSVAARVLYGLGRLRLFARVALVEAVVNLLLSLLLVGPYGLVGVAAAVAGPNVLFCLFAIAYAGRVVDVRWRTYLAAWVYPLSCGLMPLVVWTTLIPPTAPTWPGIVGGISAGLIPYTLVVAVVEGGRRLPAAVQQRWPRRTAVGRAG